MSRAAVVAIAAATMLPRVVFGQGTSSPAPDEITDVESREANLESNAPRRGIVLAVAVGPGILIGGDIGVGRGGALSLRVGHVATRKTVITFEITGTGGLHKRAMTSETLTDSNAGLFAGAQRYASDSTWGRIAGGATVFTADIGGDERTAGGIGMLVGGGLDLARWGQAVLGVETFAMSAFTRDGFKLQLGLCLGLSHY